MGPNFAKTEKTKEAEYIAAEGCQIHNVCAGNIYRTAIETYIHIK